MVETRPELRNDFETSAAKWHDHLVSMQWKQLSRFKQRLDDPSRNWKDQRG